MAIRGFVDWRGTPINREVHGGVRAAWFIYCKYLYAIPWCMYLRWHVSWMEVSNFQASFPPLFFLLAVLTVAANIVNVPNMLNMVTYLHGTMHMGVSSSATTVTNVLGATSGFALIGAFLSDSYITRSRTILLFGPLEFLVFTHLQPTGNFHVLLLSLNGN